MLQNFRGWHGWLSEEEVTDFISYPALKERTKFPHAVPHGAEVLYALNTEDRYDKTREAFTDQDREYARQVSDYFFEFARTGRPSAAGDPTLVRRKTAFAVDFAAFRSSFEWEPRVQPVEPVREAGLRTRNHKEIQRCDS